MPRPQRPQESQGTGVKVEGYINEERRSFVVTNYDECVAAGILTYVAPIKTEEQEEKDRSRFKELYEKYKPDFMRKGLIPEHDPLLTMNAKFLVDRK